MPLLSNYLRGYIAVYVASNTTGYRLPFNDLARHDNKYMQLVEVEEVDEEWSRVMMSGYITKGVDISDGYVIIYRIKTNYALARVITRVLESLQKIWEESEKQVIPLYIKTFNKKGAYGIRWHRGEYKFEYLSAYFYNKHPELWNNRMMINTNTYTHAEETE